MNATQLCISWDAYLNYVSKGFSGLQQNAEFVDMTLAAEGHLVKVHRNIVAVASPYLKAMLQSAPCQHPVIFLNNISHKILGYILEYIYTGEVKIATDVLHKFIEACKALHISGVDGIDAPKIISGNQSNQNFQQSSPQVKEVAKSLENSFAAHITINTNENNYDMELVPNESNINSTIKENLLSADLLIPTVSNISDPIISTEREDILDSDLLVPAVTNSSIISTEREDILDSDLLVPAVTNSSSNMDFATKRCHIENYETVCDNDVDINNISKFVILKPKTFCNNAELNTNKTENDVRLRNNETIVARNFEPIPGSSLVEKNTNPRDNLLNITFDTNGWHIDSIQKSSHVEVGANLVSPNANAELNTNKKKNAIRILSDKTIVPKDLHTIPESSLMASNTDSRDDIVNITIDNNSWHIDPIPEPSHIKQANPVSHPITLTLNTNNCQPEPCQSNSEAYIDLTETPLKSQTAIRPTVKRRKMKILKKIGNISKETHHIENRPKITLNKLLRKEMDVKPHYSVSNRGSLQLLLNRYLYHSHHHSNGGIKRRWRCIDYRKLHCPAYIDTNEEDVIAL